MIVSHSFDQHIVPVMKKTPEHRVSSSSLQRENRFAVGRPRFRSNLGMASAILRNWPDSMQIISIDQEGRVSRIDDLVSDRKILEEFDQLLLSSWMKMEARLIEKENCILMTIPRLNQKNEVEREKPLESLASRFQFYLNIRATIICNPDPKIIFIGVVANLVTALRPPIRELGANVRRCRIQADCTLIFTADIFRIFTHVPQIHDDLRIKGNMPEHCISRADTWIMWGLTQVFDESRKPNGAIKNSIVLKIDQHRKSIFHCLINLGKHRLFIGLGANRLDFLLKIPDQVGKLRTSLGFDFVL